jgi:L-2-hydroxyglutarate oxidase LhgO
MTSSYDFIIIGSGIIGLTIAWELKKRHPLTSIAIVEKENSSGLHASGRNSGVLHSGIYYDNSTLKSKMCSTGSKKMQLFASEHDIKCVRSGKIIIATSKNDLPTIDKLLKNSINNKINAQRLNEKEIKEIEPYAKPYKYGIYSPDTAVIDSVSLVKKLHMLLLDLGVQFKMNSTVLKSCREENAIITTNGKFSYGYLYNCSGANADRIAKMFDRGLDYTLIPFKGIYYKLNPDMNHLVNGSIYPVPDINLPFLGVHLTRVVNGDVLIGPTAIPAFGRENYGLLKGIDFGESVQIGSRLASMYLKDSNFRFLVHTEVKKYIKPYFLKSAQRLVNNLEAKDLIPSNKVGIRPQLVNIKTKSLEMDYIVEHTSNTMHVLNSISPAFTSSFAFSEWIVDKM